MAGLRHPLFPVITCFMLCMTLNLFYFSHHELFDDEHRLLDEASALLNEGVFRTGLQRAWEMPGTALFFSLWSGPHAIRFGQALMTAAMCWLIGDIANSIYGRRSANIAIWVAAVYPFFLFYQGLFLSETLFTFLLVAAFALIYRQKEPIGILVILAYIKPILLIISPLASLKFNYKKVVIRCMIILIFVSPWMFRNIALIGSPALTTSAAEVLYLGNNPNNKGGVSYANDIDPKILNKLNALPEAERERAYRFAALGYIIHDPLAFLHRAGVKFLRFWNIIPNSAEYGGIYAMIAAFSFGPLLGFAGYSAYKTDWHKLVPIYGLIIYMTILHCITIASIRYRLPIEPFLIVMASGVAKNDQH